MRLVERRLTEKRFTRAAPWRWRATFTTGAPRTALTNQREPIIYRLDEMTALQLGFYDWVTRLYQHVGLSRSSVLNEGCLRYFEDEWQALVARGCEWLEFVDNAAETVSRIDFQSACRYGSWESTQSGQMMSIPLHHYTHLE